jgi:hypothetical protein
MKLIEIINALIKQGHSIRYRHRTDGGYIITELDGLRFTGARGNTYARTLYGSYLSKAREFQLARINKAKKRVSALPTAIKRKISRVQRKWRNQHDTAKGIIKTSSVRWIYEHEGEEEALRSLEKAERYAEGYAYIENVQTLAGYVRTFGLYDIADEIEEMAEFFREEWIYPIYEILYPYQKQTHLSETDIREIERQIRQVYRR